MKPTPILISSALAVFLSGSQLVAQQPTDPPPWWGVQDDETLSLYWDFSGPNPLDPQQVATAPWYNPQVTGFALTGPLQIIPSLAGRTDVLGVLGNGTPQFATADLKVDNDPHLNWVKIFQFQFDVLEGSVGSVVESLEDSLANYERSSMTWKSTPVGGGWSRVTVDAELWPQPDDEDISWSFFTDLNDDVAIDDLYVNSRCVKVEDADEAGEAMGKVDGLPFGQLGLDLTGVTGRACVAAAMTEEPTTGARRYWVSSIAPNAITSHAIVQLDALGTTVLAVTSLPENLANAPNGASDLAVETVHSGPLFQQFVYGIIDRRGTPLNDVIVRGIDANTGALIPGLTLTVQLPSVAAPDNLGLAFNPDGNGGAGTFLVTDSLGNAYEIERPTGQVIRTFSNFPPRSGGLGYDHIFGRYYAFSSQPEATPAGNLRCNGHEFSAYDFEPTGTRFWGNLQIPNAGGPPGGTATGLEVYRYQRTAQRGQMRLLCVVQTGAGSWLYKLHGPFKFGQSRHGRTGMRGQPFELSSNFELTLDGLRPGTAAFAAIYAGFSNTVFGPTPLPVPLASFGLIETKLLISPDLRGTLVAPAANGQFRFLMPTLPVGFRNVEMFFQWLVFDPTVTNGLAMSSGGKTLIY
ncbi:MAG: hypothetical protein NXI31_11555 [bacterium]|nr:hypothetical protein [bacterium]